MKLEIGSYLFLKLQIPIIVWLKHEVIILGIKPSFLMKV